MLAEGARANSFPQGTSFVGPRQSKATRASLQATDDTVKTVQATQAARAAESQNSLAIVAPARADMENQQKERELAKRLAAISLERKQTREAQAANWEQLQ